MITPRHDLNKCLGALDFRRKSEKIVKIVTDTLSSQVGGGGNDPFIARTIGE